MPIIKSAKKRVRVAAKARERNLRTKRQVREALKTLAKVLASSGKPAEIFKAQQAAMSALDTAVKKNVIHKNKAARLKSKLANKIKQAGIKTSQSAAKSKAQTKTKKTATKKTNAAKTTER
jgi:small subunit ribosomal protein S20